MFIKIYNWSTLYDRIQKLLSLCITLKILEERPGIHSEA